MSCLVNYVYNMWHATGGLRSSHGNDQGGQTSQRDNLVTTLPREINIITVSLFLSHLSSAICPRHQPPPLALKLLTLLKLRQPTPECRHPPSSCVKNINKITTLLLWLDTLTPAPCLQSSSIFTPSNRDLTETPSPPAHCYYVSSPLSYGKKTG